MKFLRRHWYNVGFFVALLSSAALLLAWDDLSVLRRLLVLNFIAVQLHQFEEYAYPGGLPATMNILQQKKIQGSGVFKFRRVPVEKRAVPFRWNSGA